MASRLSPYISFKGTAKEAMEFYQAALGGELNLNTFGEFGMKGPEEDLIMHAQLETPAGYLIMASDTPEHMEYTPGSAISVSISGDDAEAMRGYFNQLSEGGQITQPLEKQMWGDEFGMFVDKFGINWMVNIAGEAA